jgi:hypothetical protein
MKVPLLAALLAVLGLFLIKTKSFWQEQTYDSI